MFRLSLGNEGGLGGEQGTLTLTSTSCYECSENKPFTCMGSHSRGLVKIVLGGEPHWAIARNGLDTSHSGDSNGTITSLSELAVVSLSIKG